MGKARHAIWSTLLALVGLLEQQPLDTTTIAEISVEDGTPVQYGDVLFRLK